MNVPAERVVLLHGLSRTRRSLARLEAALCDAGYDVLNWDYPSRHHSVAQLVALFRELCFELARNPKRTHFIGHSLGGLIIRAGLLEPVGFPLGRLVLIASPNRGVGIVRRFEEVPLLADLPRLFGQPALELGRDAGWLRDLGVPAAEVGVIAGTRGFHPLNPSSWFNTLLGNTQPHDGTVELDSAMLPGMRDFLSLDVAHTFICDDERVIAAALRFLREGRFSA
jgi:pimeloyl-ACP methyl ester carboxylesterase